MIDLVTDICKRNNIKELKWKGNKSLIGQVDKQNMTVHKWFADTSCPGDYLYTRMSDIASKVNERLKNAPSSTPKALYRVQVGAFANKNNAETLVRSLKANGYEAFITLIEKN